MLADPDAAFTPAAAQWLSRPWAAALLRLVADPASDLDERAVPYWPAWAPLGAALTSPACRGRLGRLLAPGQDEDVEGVIRACFTPQVRLALIPVADALEVMALAAAWMDAPRLAGLLRGGDVVAARAELGGGAFDFATRRGRLMPRPPETLVEALAPGTMTARGAALFGLAIGNVPDALRARLRLRRPQPVWSVVAGQQSEAAISDAAFSAIRRVAREAAPPWLSWLS